MALIELTLDGKHDKVKTAIQRIKMFDPIANGWSDKPFYVAYSGGKDSDALRILYELSGVQYELVHNLTTVDAPETVRYVRSIPGVRINKPAESMWQLIIRNGMPPTRLVRYCCAALKERGGQGRYVATGVRWAESARRKRQRGIAEVLTTKKSDNLILMQDNADNRRLMEVCQLRGKRIVNPIVDWTDADVWELLRYYGCQSNPLYACGYKRVGCIGCPMSTRQREGLERYPKYRDMYIRTFGLMIARRQADGKVITWSTGQECYDWWVGPASGREADGQQYFWEEKA